MTTVFNNEFTNLKDSATPKITKLLLVLGDQLDEQSLIFKHYHAENSLIMMFEVMEESIGEQWASNRRPKRSRQFQGLKT